MINLFIIDTLSTIGLIGSQNAHRGQLNFELILQSTLNGTHTSIACRTHFISVARNIQEIQ